MEKTSAARLRIKEEASKQGLSLNKLAALAGLAQPLVFKLANGQTTGIQFNKLDALAKALNVRPSELIIP